MALIDFLKTTRTKDELTTCLKIIQEFKAEESDTEWIYTPFDEWRRLEHLEDYLKLLTGIEADTVKDENAKQYMIDNNI